jgi:DUF2934 family protein
MDAEWEDKVRARAYAIWERRGWPEGEAERHWAQAEEELRAEQDGPRDQEECPPRPARPKPRPPLRRTGSTQAQPPTHRI